MIREYRTGSVVARVEKGQRLAKKATEYLKYHGVRALTVKVYDKLFNPAMKPVIYADWIKKHLPSDRAIEKQKKEPGEALVSTVLFANASRVIHDRVDIRKVEPLTERQYTVGGCAGVVIGVVAGLLVQLLS